MGALRVRRAARRTSGSQSAGRQQVRRGGGGRGIDEGRRRRAGAERARASSASSRARVCWKDRQATPLASTPARMATTLVDAASTARAEPRRGCSSERRPGTCRGSARRPRRASRASRRSPDTAMTTRARSRRGQQVAARELGDGIDPARAQAGGGDAGRVVRRAHARAGRGARRHGGAAPRVARREVVGQRVQRVGLALEVGEEQRGVHRLTSRRARQQGGQGGVGDVAPVREVAHGVEVLAALLLQPQRRQQPLVEQLERAGERERRAVRVEERGLGRGDPRRRTTRVRRRRRCAARRPGRRGRARRACRRRRSAAGCGADRSCGASTGLPSKSVTQYSAGSPSTQHLADVQVAVDVDESACRRSRGKPRTPRRSAPARARSRSPSGRRRAAPRRRGRRRRARSSARVAGRRRASRRPRRSAWCMRPASSPRRAAGATASSSGELAAAPGGVRPRPPSPSRPRRRAGTPRPWRAGAFAAPSAWST